MKHIQILHRIIQSMKFALRNFLGCTARQKTKLCFYWRSILAFHRPKAKSKRLVQFTTKEKSGIRSEQEYVFSTEQVIDGNPKTESRDDQDWEIIVHWLEEFYESITGSSLNLPGGSEQDEACYLSTEASKVGKNNELSIALRLAAAYRNQSDNSLQFDFLDHSHKVFEKTTAKPKALKDFEESVDIDLIIQKEPEIHLYRVWRARKIIQNFASEFQTPQTTLNRKELKYFTICMNDCALVINTSQSNANQKILSDAHRYRGILHFWQKKWESAAQDLGKAMESCDDYNPQCLHIRGQSLLAMKNYKCALKDFEKYISLMPRDQSGYMWKAITYDRIGERRLAALALEEVKENSIEVLVTSEILGKQFFQAMDWDSAIFHFQKAIEDREILNFRSYNYLGISFFKTGRYKEAKELFNTYHSIMTSRFMHEANICALSNRGRCHYEMKEYISAIIDFSKAIQIDHEFLGKKHSHRLFYWRALSKYKAKELLSAIDDLTIVTSTASKFKKDSKELLRCIQKEMNT